MIQVCLWGMGVWGGWTYANGYHQPWAGPWASNVWIFILDLSWQYFFYFLWFLLIAEVRPNVHPNQSHLTTWWPLGDRLVTTWIAPSGALYISMRHFCPAAVNVVRSCFQIDDCPFETQTNVSILMMTCDIIGCCSWKGDGRNKPGEMPSISDLLHLTTHLYKQRRTQYYTNKNTNNNVCWQYAYTNANIWGSATSYLLYDFIWEFYIKESLIVGAFLNRGACVRAQGVRAT